MQRLVKSFIGSSLIVLGAGSKGVKGSDMRNLNSKFSHTPNFSPFDQQHPKLDKYPIICYTSALASTLKGGFIPLL